MIEKKLLMDETKLPSIIVRSKFPRAYRTHVSCLWCIIFDVEVGSRMRSMHLACLAVCFCVFFHILLGG